MPRRTLHHKMSRLVTTVCGATLCQRIRPSTSTPVGAVQGGRVAVGSRWDRTPQTASREPRAALRRSATRRGPGATPRRRGRACLYAGVLARRERALTSLSQACRLWPARAGAAPPVPPLARRTCRVVPRRARARPPGPGCCFPAARGRLYESATGRKWRIGKIHGKPPRRLSTAGRHAGWRWAAHARAMVRRAPCVGVGD